MPAEPMGESSDSGATSCVVRLQVFGATPRSCRWHRCERSQCARLANLHVGSVRTLGAACRQGQWGIDRDQDPSRGIAIACRLTTAPTVIMAIPSHRGSSTRLVGLG